MLIERNYLSLFKALTEKSYFNTKLKLALRALFHLLLHHSQALLHSPTQVGLTGLQYGTLDQSSDSTLIICSLFLQHHLRESSFAVSPKSFDSVELRGIYWAEYKLYLVLLGLLLYLVTMVKP